MRSRSIINSSAVIGRSTGTARWRSTGATITRRGADARTFETDLSRAFARSDEGFVREMSRLISLLVFKSFFLLVRFGRARTHRRSTRASCSALQTSQKDPFQVE